MSATRLATQRTTLMIPGELRDRLRQIAAERGVSMSTVVREALEERVARVRPTPRSLGVGASVRPTPRSLGVGASGSTDTALRTTVERPEPRAWR